MATKIQSAANVDVSLALQTDYETPNTISLEHGITQSADASPGNVDIQGVNVIGKDTVHELMSTQTTVDKTVKFLNTPIQLRKLAEWVFGSPVNDVAAPLALMVVGCEGSPFARLTANASEITLEVSVDGTTYTTAGTIVLATYPTVSKVVEEINKITGWNADLFYGKTTQNFTFAGSVDIYKSTLVPATTETSTVAKLAVFEPKIQDPKYMTIAYKLFKNSVPVWGIDIGALVKTLTLSMGRAAPSSVEIGFIAREHIYLETAPADPAPADTSKSYKFGKGLYSIRQGGYRFFAISEVSFTHTNTTAEEKNWEGYQMETGISMYETESQIQGFLEKEMYDWVVDKYSSNQALGSSFGVMIRVINEELVDKTNEIPFSYGISYPSAMVSAAPQLQVEAAGTISCPYTIKPTTFGIDIGALQFAVIYK